MPLFKRNEDLMPFMVHIFDLSISLDDSRAKHAAVSKNEHSPKVSAFCWD